MGIVEKVSMLGVIIWLLLGVRYCS